MADALSIKDLPDTSRIDDNVLYLVPGKTLRTIDEVLRQLWRGENVGKGPNIRLRQNGLSGYTITGADQNSETGLGSFPFKIYDASVGSAAKIRVNSGDGFAGAIGNVIANIGGVGINYTPPSGGPSNPPVLTCNDGDSLYARCLLDSTGTYIETADAFGVTLVAAPTVPGPSTSNPPTYANLLIGTLAVRISGGNATVIPAQVVTDSQWFLMCGTSPLFGGLGS